MQIDPNGLSRARRYFLLTSCIVPRPIAWVGTLGEDGGYNLAPFSFFNGFSATPPIIGIGFGPHETKEGKDTLLNVRRSGELTVSIPSMHQVEKLDFTSDDLPYSEDEFAYAGLTPLPGQLVSAPRVAEAPISLECRVYELKPLGDGGSHLLLAEILLFHIEDRLLDFRGTVDPHRLMPLARMGGGRYAELGEIFKVERE